MDPQQRRDAVLIGRPSIGQPGVGRGLTCLRAFRGKIYAGFGDWTDNTGPIELVAYDPSRNEFVIGPTLETEAVDEMRVIDDALWVPEVDHTGWFWFHSDVHVFDGTEWASSRLDRAVHVFDVAKLRDRVFVAYQYNPKNVREGYHRIAELENGQVIDPAVFESRAGGRFLKLVSCGDWLYVFTFGRTNAYRSRGEGWQPWTAAHFGPGFTMRAESDGEDAVVIRGHIRFGRPEGLQFFNTSAFHIEQDGTGTPIWWLRMPVDVKPAEERFFVLDRQTRTTSRIVSTEDFGLWRTELKIESDSPPVSLEILDGDFYVGLQNGELWRLVED